MAAYIYSNNSSSISNYSTVCNYLNNSSNITSNLLNRTDLIYGIIRGGLGTLDKLP